MTTTNGIGIIRHQPQPDRAQNPSQPVPLVAAVAMLLAVVPMVAFIRVEFDGAGRVLDPGGAEIYTFTGTLGNTVNQIVYSICILIFFYYSLTGQRVRVIGTALATMVVLLTVWLLIAEAHRNEGSYSYISTATAGLAAVALTRVRSDRNLLGILARIQGLVAIAQLVFIAVQPSDGIKECRVDKCSVFGNLWTSFYSNENNFGLVVAMALPIVAFEQIGRAHV